MTTYFEILIVKLDVLNTHIKYRTYRILFTIRSIKLFFMHNFKLQKLEI